jgi:predicted nucleic acid-binding protein
VIILDTNVVLALTQDDLDARVVAWLDAEDERDLWLTSITVAELQVGVEREPLGALRTAMQQQVVAIVDEDFPNRILAFDLDAALAFAEIAAPFARADRRIRTLDFQIAAIARAHGAIVATRNVDDFADCGIELVNPWTVA